MPTSPKPRKRLPENPSEENLRKQAKGLAKEKDLQLAAAQREFAVEYGFRSWAELMEAVVVADRFVPFLPLRELIAFPHETYPIFVGRPMSIRAVEAAANGKTPILLVAQRDSKLAQPSASDMYEIGTLGTINQWIKLSDGTIKTEITGKQRAKVSRFLFDREFYQAECEEISALSASTELSAQVKALMRSVLSAFNAYEEHEGRVPFETAKAIESVLAAITDPAFLAHKMVGHLQIPIAEKQALLETSDAVGRLETILRYLEDSSQSAS